VSLTQEQLQQRANRIGSSSAAAIAGLSPYSTAIGEWLKITGRVEYEPSDATELGHAIEDGIGRRSAEKLSLAHIERNCGQSTLFDDFAIATQDFDAWTDFGEGHGTPPDAVLEVKNVSVRVMDRWDEDDPSGYPDYVYAQVQDQMHVLGRRRAYIGAAVAGLGPFTYVVDYDEGFAAGLMQILRDFHRQHVLTGIAPDLDWSDGAAEYLRITYPKRVQRIVKATPDIEDVVAELKELRAESMRVNRKVDQRKHVICDFMGAADADVLDSEIGRITWRWQNGRTRSGDLIRNLAHSEPVSAAELKALKGAFRGEPFRVFNVDRRWNKE
jgi:predicted phage-related endonuclease